MPLLLPYFKFNVQDWLTSESILKMSGEQIGAYIMLLAHCWANANCTLPDDALSLRRLARYGGTDTGFGEVVDQFHALKGKRLTNRRLYAEWEEAMTLMTKLKESGQKGAATRWQKVEEKRRARTERTPHINGKTAFPSDWKLTPEEAAQWSKHGLNPHIEFASFKDHALTTDRRCKDWQAAYRNWCRKSIAKLEAAR